MIAGGMLVPHRPPPFSMLALDCDLALVRCLAPEPRLMLALAVSDEGEANRIEGGLLLPVRKEDAGLEVVANAPRIVANLKQYRHPRALPAEHVERLLDPVRLRPQRHAEAAIGRVALPPQLGCPELMV